MKYYVIDENNSGGVYCNPHAASYIVVRADNKDEAMTILKNQEWYSEDYCDCCGKRWDSFKLLNRDYIYEGLNNDVIQFYNWDSFKLLNRGYIYTNGTGKVVYKRVD